MKRIIALMLSLSLFSANAFAEVNSIRYENDGEAVLSVDIIHTSDVHGNAEENGNYIGYGKIAGYIDSIRENNSGVLVFDTGDTYEGLPYSNITKGESIVPILKTIGYDAMTLGNHEFSYDTETRNSLIQEAGIPVVSANITDEKGNLIYDEYIIKDIGDLKVGIFGLTTEETKTSVLSENVEGIEFYNAEESARRAVSNLEEENCDFIIALTHLGSADTENNASMKLAEAVDGIDLLLDGHSHVVNEGTMCGDTLLVASGYYGGTLGHITLDFDENEELLNARVEMLTAEDFAETESDSKVDSIVSEYVSEANEFFDKVIAETDIEWTGDAETTRTRPTNLGTFVAESYREIAGADIGIINSGGVRQPVNPGKVTNRDIYAVQPFSNTISGYYAKGSDIIATFKESLEAMGTGEFLQYSGIKAEYDSSTNEIISLSLADGSPLEPDKKYVIATSSFITTNQHFPELSENAEYITDYGIDYEIVLQYIAKNGMKEVPILITDLSTETEETDSYINPFIDVNIEDWFYESVKTANKGGLFKGVTSTTFEPYRPVTRAMLIEVLYRAEGNPETNADSGFTDVFDTAYYAKAAAWGRENGIISGISQNEFAPDSYVTREQTAAILQRYGDYKGYDTSQKGDLSAFSDSDKISSWAEENMSWAVGNGIISGKDSDTLDPSGITSRAEAAALIYRFEEIQQ